MHDNSMELMKDFKEEYVGLGARVLDVGSLDINGGYKEIFTEAEGFKYYGADVQPGPNVDVVLRDPYDWRGVIADESMDVVISGQAFEHIKFFWRTAEEMARVLVPGGFCCIIAPSGGPEHRYPVDCWRFYPDGMRALAEYMQFDVLDVRVHWDGKCEWHDNRLVAQKPFRIGK